MKKLSLMLVLGTMLFACGNVKAEVEMYNYVNLTEIANLSFSGNTMNLQLKGEAGDNDGTQAVNITVQARLNPEFFTIMTSQLKKVQQYRIKKDLLETLIKLHNDLTFE